MTDKKTTPEDPDTEDQSSDSAAAEPASTSTADDLNRASSPPSPRTGSGSSGLAAFALLLAAAALALSGWQWWQGSRAAADAIATPDRATIEQWVDQAVSSSVTAANESNADQAGNLASDMENRFTALQDSVERLASELSSSAQQAERNLDNRLRTQQSDNNQIIEQLNSLEQRQNQADSRLLRLSQAVNVASPASSDDSRTQIILAETESLLQQAQMLLAAGGDSRQAGTLLQLAIDRVGSSEEPLLADLQSRLDSTQQDMLAVEQVDLNRISSSLDRMAGLVASLPLLMDRVTDTAEPEEADSGYWDKLRNSMSDLVVVRTDLNEAHHLTTLETERLRDELRLQLQVARLAAIRRDQSLFDSSLLSVSEDLRRYFDSEQAQTGNFLQQLDELLALQLQPAMPDLKPLMSEARRLAATLKQLDRTAAPTDSPANTDGADS